MRPSELGVQPTARFGSRLSARSHVNVTISPVDGARRDHGACGHPSARWLQQDPSDRDGRAARRPRCSPDSGRNFRCWERRCWERHAGQDSNAAGAERPSGTVGGLRPRRRVRRMAARPGSRWGSPAGVRSGRQQHRAQEKRLGSAAARCRHPLRKASAVHRAAASRTVYGHRGHRHRAPRGSARATVSRL